MYYVDNVIELLSIISRKLNSVSLQETHENGVLHPVANVSADTPSELEESSDFVFEKIAAAKARDDSRHRHSTVNSEDDLLLNGDPFLFENAKSDAAGNADRDVTDCARTNHAPEGETDASGGECCDGASEPIPVPAGQPRDGASSKSIETSSETLVSDNLFCR